MAAHTSGSWSNGDKELTCQVEKESMNARQNKGCIGFGVECNRRPFAIVMKTRGGRRRFLFGHLCTVFQYPTRFNHFWLNNITID